MRQMIVHRRAWAWGSLAAAAAAAIAGAIVGVILQRAIEPRPIEGFDPYYAMSEHCLTNEPVA
jgi:hypothetical protein